LANASAAEVSIWNRTHPRARELAEAFGARAVERPEAADIVVNTTSVGLHDGDELSELPLELLEQPPVAVELVYRAGDSTPFADWALRGGSRLVPGIEILVRQGALSFRRWTGQDAPLEVMRQAARGEIAPQT
jgi:shikimate dehydrogenase